MTTTTATNTVDSNTTARSIIGDLEGKFAQEGKQTCRSCLRSKALPCSQVTTLAASVKVVWTEPLLRRVHQILSKEYTKFPTSVGGVFVDQANNNNHPVPVSSLLCMSRAVTILRFMQLLLLLSGDASNNNDQPSAVLSPNDADQMIASLLQQWTHGVTEYVCEAWKKQQAVKSTQDSVDNDDDENQTTSTTRYNPMTANASADNDPRPFFCFCFLSLQRMNDYVNGRGRMIVPVWKGLCELAEVLVKVQAVEWRHSLPSTLLPGAMEILYGFLQGGIQQLDVAVMQTNVAENAASLIAYQGKLLAFIASKLSHMMRVYFILDQKSCSNANESPDPSHEDLMTDCWKILFSLRGMAITLQLLDSASKKNLSSQANAPPSNLAQLQVLGKIAAKTGKCVQYVFFGAHQSAGSSVLLKLAMESVVGGSGACTGPCDEAPDSSHLAQFRAISQALGRVSILQAVLDNVDSSVPENKEIMLATVEDLLFVSIPQCLGACTLSAKNKYDGSQCLTLPSTFMFKSLETMAGVLVEMTIDSSSLAQLHRLLIRWLATSTEGDGDETVQQHPMTRELVLMLLQAYITGVGRDVGAAFTSYLPKILFDSRTSPTLRNNVSALMVRLQTSSDSNISEYSRKLVENEFSVWIQHSTGKTSKKRKRKEGKTGLRIQDPLEAVHISSALKGRGLSEDLSKTTLPSVIQKTINRLFDGCSKEEENAHEKLLIPFAERSAFLFAFLERYLVFGAQDGKESFQKHTGLDILDIIRVVLKSIMNIKFDLSDDGGTIQKKAILCSAAMRLSATASEAFGANNTGAIPIDLISSMISKSGSKRFLPKSDNVHFISIRPAMSFDSLRVLASVGVAIPSDCQDAVLQGVKKSFQRLLSSQDWPLVAFGITALSRFGASVDVSHKPILRPCLPNFCSKLFQCRVNKKVWKNKSLGEVERDAIAIAGNTDKQLRGCCSTKQGRGSNFFPETSCFSIANGSYILEMTTQEGRKAKVIFPPGLESLEDIECMMGGCGEATPIHTVKRFVTASSGEVTGLLHRVS